MSDKQNGKMLPNKDNYEIRLFEGVEPNYYNTKAWS